MSENPQVDPRQGFGGAYQGPGQVPPPMPGQAPPPVPPQAPGAPSAWSQPMPPGGPGGPGPRTGRSPLWLIGGAAVLVAAVVAGVLVATSGDDDGKSAASGKPPGVPGGAAKPEAPSEGKVFSKVPKGCELIKASTIEKIAPGGVCTPGLMDNKDLATMITRMPRWEAPDSGSNYQSLDVNVTVGPSAVGMYDIYKKTAMKDMGPTYEVTDSRSLSGLGEKAFVVHAVDDSLVWVKVLVREGNAMVRTEFVYSKTSSDRTQQQTEADAVTAVRDVLGSMS
ncbi:hypothetical protein [Streptomyces sp. NPDC058308]|uniref:hypothetical protein n=1 Tax=Streptomyces sp. NPDC058308 TaxID=3346440 RepID=UPI0036DFB7E8